MEARIEDGKLVIELPLEKPRLSSTGKTLLVASTRGVQRTGARFKGKPISMVVNAFIPETSRWQSCVRSPLGYGDATVKTKKMMSSKSPCSGRNLNVRRNRVKSGEVGNSQEWPKLQQSTEKYVTALEKTTFNRRSRENVGDFPKSTQNHTNPHKTR